MQFNLFAKKPSTKEKISKAQQSTLLIVGAASVVVGAGIIMIVNLTKYIAFNGEVIDGKEQAIQNYSEVIKESGACESPKSEVYTVSELNKCTPDEIDYKDVPGTLRSNILSDAASNIGLESVARTSISECINPETSAQYTHDELEELYENTDSSSKKRKYLKMIKNCSALRTASDALPNVANKESLLASLNNIYLLAGVTPSSLAPASSNNTVSDTGSGYSSIPVSLSMTDDNNTDLEDVIRFLNELSKSIRYFSVKSLSYDVDSEEITASAEAYYVNEVESTEKTVTLKLKDKK